MMMRGFLMLLLFPGILLSGEVETNTFRNLAGYAIQGAVTALEEDTVTLQTAKGDEVKLSLSIFPESEQRRLRVAAGQPSLPTDLRRQLTLYRQQAQRLRVLAGRKRLSTEELTERLVTLHKAGEAVIAEADLLPEERDYARTLLVNPMP